LKKNNRYLWLFFIIAALLLSACAHYPENAALTSYDPDTGYRYPSVDETAAQDRIYVALAFSGGGTRAAAFSYGVLKGLNETPLPGQPGKTLLDEVDLISSVSGGSFTAAYFGLHGKGIFDDFNTRFLLRDIQGDLAKNFFSPQYAFKLLSPYYSRIDIAAELYGDIVFDKTNYQRLVDKGRRPFIAVNATNMTTGAQFTFTQGQFDVIGSDLSKFAIGRAVAASSAFPFLLTPVSLVNQPAPAGFSLPKDVENGLKDFGVNDRRYVWAKNLAEYHENKESRPFLHLMDGGLADNIGLRYIMDAYLRTSGPIFKRKARIDHLVIITVNAKTAGSDKLDREEKSPGIADMAYKTATVSMDNYSFETIEVAESRLSESIKAKRYVEVCRSLLKKHCGAGDALPEMPQGFKLYFIDLNFLKVKDDALRKRLLAMPTSFKLDSGQVQDLIDTGVGLIKESKGVHSLIKALESE
jgi:NTE family protein